MRTLQGISPGELAASVVFPRLDTNLYFSDENYKAKIEYLLRRGVGGFCLFGGTLRQTANLTSLLSALAKEPPFFCADFENGLGMRISDAMDFPHAMALGKAGEEATRQIAESIAKQAKTIGVTWVLAPVCDVNTNRENPIINIRSFGETADLVSRNAKAYVEGMCAHNVTTCAKHFPGHGDTSMDSHLTTPVVKHDFSRIDKIELEPFRAAIDAGVRSIMTSHISAPALDESGTPASLSKKMTSGLLREYLRFGGLIITDALDMKAISENYSSADAAMKALNAGTDVVLLPEDVNAVIDAIEQRLSNDSEFKKRIYESYKKISIEKRWCGLTFKPPTFDESYLQTFMSDEKEALKTAFSAIEIFGDKSLLPIDESKRIAAFAFVQDEDVDPPAFFFKLLAQAVENELDFAFVDANATDENLEDLLKGIEGAELTICAYFYRAKAYSGVIDLDDRLASIAGRLTKKTNSISVFLGNPYLKERVKSDCSILAYSDSKPSIAASVMALAGRDTERM